MSARYPYITKALKWLVGYLIGCVLPLAIGYYLGVQKGQEIGRLEMKCAIFGVMDRFSGDDKSPGDGCERTNRGAA